MVYAKKKRKKKSAKDVRQELDQPQEIISALDRGVNAVVSQWKPILIGLVVVGALLAGVSFFQGAASEKENLAAALVYDAEMKLPDPSGYGFGALMGDEDSTDEKLQEAVTEFDKAVAEYGDTIQADIANLESGHALFEMGDFQGSADRYKLAADSKSRMVRLLALNSQATALESLEQYTEATEILQQITVDGSGATREYAYLDRIRVQELSGDTAGALATCREFEEKHSDSPKLEDVQARIRALGEEPVKVDTSSEDTPSTEEATS